MSVIRSITVALIAAAALVVAPAAASAGNEWGPTPDPSPTGTTSVNNWPWT